MIAAFGVTLLLSMPMVAQAKVDLLQHSAPIQESGGYQSKILTDFSLPSGYWFLHHMSASLGDIQSEKRLSDDSGIIIVGKSPERSIRSLGWLSLSSARYRLRVVTMLTVTDTEVGVSPHSSLADFDRWAGASTWQRPPQTWSEGGRKVTLDDRPRVLLYEYKWQKRCVKSDPSLATLKTGACHFRLQEGLDVDKLMERWKLQIECVGDNSALREVKCVFQPR